jgi:hypothetical protein
MPSQKKKQARGPQKMSDAEASAFIDALKQFKEDGTGSVIDATLLAEFPLFRGQAPTGHPYPQAFTDSPTDAKHLFLRKSDGMVLLCRHLSNGRIIQIDTDDFKMLNGGFGIAHLNMDNSDNRIDNIKLVTEAEARKMLLEYEI